MVVFLADRPSLQIRRLHRRIKNRFQSDGRFETVRLRVAEPREPGPYRVVARTNPRWLLDDSSYPEATARIEVGFQRAPHAPREHYWFNWIEPDREFLLGWHRDDDHPDLGPVHLQLNHGGNAFEHLSARLVDEHPLAVVESRLDQLSDLLARVVWEDGRPVDLDL